MNVQFCVVRDRHELKWTASEKNLHSLHALFDASLPNQRARVFAYSDGDDGCLVDSDESLKEALSYFQSRQLSFQSKDQNTPLFYVIYSQKNNEAPYFDDSGVPLRNKLQRILETQRDSDLALQLAFEHDEEARRKKEREDNERKSAEVVRAMLAEEEERLRIEKLNEAAALRIMNGLPPEDPDAVDGLDEEPGAVLVSKEDLSGEVKRKGEDGALDLTDEELARRLRDEELKEHGLRHEQESRDAEMAAEMNRSFNKGKGVGNIFGGITDKIAKLTGGKDANS